MDTKAQATQPQEQQPRTYEDFKPFANWVTEETNTLEVHLHDFRKEQLRVQLENPGKLKISGERPIEGSRWSRFCLNISVPKHSNIKEIQAKFSNGILHVLLPKKTIKSPVQEDQQQPTPTPETKNDDQNKLSGNEAMNKKRSDQSQLVNGSSENAGAGIGGLNSGNSGVKMAWLNKPKRAAISVAIAIVVVVGLGIYAVYRLRSSSSSSASTKSGN